MRNCYRLVGLALLLGLSQPGLGQTAPAREDSLKGRIWTATAQRIWTDEKVAAPPKKWATGSDFTKWVLTQKPDKTELGSLFGAVLTRLGKSQPATPTQVSQAILAEVGQRKAHKTGALAKVNLQALRVDLAPFLPAARTIAAVLPAADSAAPAATSYTSSAQQVAEDANPAPEAHAATPPTYTMQLAPPRYFGLPPAAAGAVLAVLSALLGAGIAASQVRKKYRHRRHHASPTPPVALENSPNMTSPEYRKLQNQNKQLHKELQQLKQQLAALRKQLPSAPASPAAPAAAEAPVVTPATAAPVAPAATTEVPAETADDALFAITMTVPTGSNKPQAAPAPQSPAATRYGPVQETPFVEERKIVDAPLPQLALMLTINPQAPDQATFTLNPHVDQARLIGDGLTRLQKFFDYNPPLGGRISLVTAAAPGQLQRHADGWQVVQRARLTIS